MRTHTRRIVALAALAIAIASPAAAQQSVADVLTFLITNQSIPSGSFDRDRAAAQATSDTISRALLTSLATQTVMTSSSAFVYRLDPLVGTVARVTPTFGPFFVDRALTAGRGQMSIGLTVQHVRYTSLDGNDLRDGTLVTTANQFVDEPAPFDVDRLALDIAADVTTLYGNIGITDRLDVGFAAPIVALRLHGSRVNTYRGREFTQAAATAHALGPADLVVRSKVLLADQDGERLAAAVDVRLPTGNRNDLLGAGSTSLRLSALGSLEAGRLSGHAEAGVAFGGLARELHGGAAAALAAGNHLTITGELIGRWVDTPGGIMAAAAAHPTLNGVTTLRLVPEPSTLPMLNLVPGLKWNVTGTWVLAASVSVPLTHAGLTSGVAPFVGIDYVLEP